MQVKVAFIGAGGINFGSPEGPWNHSARLQLLPDVTFSAIVDPNRKLAQDRIDTLQKGTLEACLGNSRQLEFPSIWTCRQNVRPAAGEHGKKWKNTKVFPNYQALLKDTGSKPTAAFIGLPPKYHGALEDPNANIEVSKTLQQLLLKLWDIWACV